MKNVNEITVGARIGRLVVEEEAQRRGVFRYFLCICDCGKEKEIRGTSLIGAKPTQSCGCLTLERVSESKSSKLSGMQFGRWTVLNRVYGDKKNSQWLCRCSCGTERVVKCNRLKSGESKSCGCHAHTLPTASGGAMVRHGQSKKGKRTPEYRTWAHMLERCNNANTPNYSRYGGRGISVCERWVKFENFITDMGARPEGRYTLDRIDNDGDYCPENCRWATYKQQARNTSTNRILNVGGIARCVAEWAEINGIKKSTISSRLALGWPPEMAVQP